METTTSEFGEEAFRRAFSAVGRKEASRSDTGKWNMKSAIDESGIGSNSA